MFFTDFLPLPRPDVNQKYLFFPIFLNEFPMVSTVRVDSKNSRTLRKEVVLTYDVFNIECYLRGKVIAFEIVFCDAQFKNFLTSWKSHVSFLRNFKLI